LYFVLPLLSLSSRIINFLKIKLFPQSLARKPAEYRRGQQYIIKQTTPKFRNSYNQPDGFEKTSLTYSVRFKMEGYRSEIFLGCGIVVFNVGNCCQGDSKPIDSP